MYNESEALLFFFVFTLAMIFSHSTGWCDFFRLISPYVSNSLSREIKVTYKQKLNLFKKKKVEKN